MGDFVIIDRRLNPKGKNLPNRERFINRHREAIAKRVQDLISKRSITDTKGADVTVGTGTDEPGFVFDRDTGEWEYVVPGNDKYLTGDEIEKPLGGGQGGGGRKAGQGEGEDDFTFSITEDEYLDFIFEGLELPDMAKQSEKAAVAYERVRAGVSTTGAAPALDVVRSFKNSLGRRVALKFPLGRKIEELEEQLALLAEGDPARAAIEEQLEALRRRHNSIAYIDPVDVRYRRHEKKPIPNCQAVMFCVMDVSGSMGEHEKDIAKRFFLLLHLFLKRSYKKLDVVFIKHTDAAWECDEKAFFYSRESGGTAFSPAVKLVSDIIRDRYPTDTWNIYTAWASDGDNDERDNAATEPMLDLLLQQHQFFVYLQTLSENRMFAQAASSAMFAKIAARHKNFADYTIFEVDSVMPVFRDIFSKEKG